MNFFKNFTTKRVVLFFYVLFIIFSTGYSQSVNETEIRTAAEHWINKNIQQTGKRTLFIAQTSRIRQIENRTLDQCSLSFYIVHLEPTGFIIMNSDKRLPPVLAYSKTSVLNLEDSPQNAFRDLLKNSMEQSLNQILRVPSRSFLSATTASISETSHASDWDRLLQPEEDYSLPIFGVLAVTDEPFLSTAWYQNNHYNELCPEYPNARFSYDGRVPVGCVAVAGAQIMKHYNWPYRGKGSHSYIDAEGSSTGVYSAVFSDPFDWVNMQNEYDAFESEPQAAVDAVSELMYEVGVSVEMNYENAGSLASIRDLNQIMESKFFYDLGIYLWDGTNSQAIADQLIPEMQASRPAIVSIPGHAVVADGYNAAGYFHINYGWGGSNNVWYLISEINNNNAISCITGLYPSMVPLNITEDGSTNTSAHLKLKWNIADVRESEVQSVAVLRHFLKTSIFSDSADNFSVFKSTSTDDIYDWVVTNAGYSGNCFFKQSSSYTNEEYHLTSIKKFVPKSGAQLTFQLKARLDFGVFRVMVSSDDGQTYSEKYSLTNYHNDDLTWQSVTVDFSEYANSEVLIRFENVPGNSYSDGGVWLDEIEFAGAEWYNRETLPATLLDSADDFSKFKSTSTDDTYDWIVTNAGYSGNCFFKHPEGHTDEKYQLTSIEKFVPENEAQLTFQLKARLASSEFKVMVSSDNGKTYSKEYSLTNYYNDDLTWQLVTVDLSAYANSEVLIRFENVIEYFYPSGGIWLDEIEFAGCKQYNWETLQTDFSDSADDFSKFKSTSTDDTYDWVVTNAGYSGNCFFKQPAGHTNKQYHLTSIEKFVPKNGAKLTFQLKAWLAFGVFRVMVSSDEGQSYSEKYSLTNTNLTWQSVTVDLSEYANSKVLIRFENMPGRYYSSGGIWLDEIEFTGGEWYDWETLHTTSGLSGTTISNLTADTYDLAFQAFDGTKWGTRSPEFSVFVAAENLDIDKDGLPNGWELSYFGGETNANPDATASNGVNTIREAYIAGIDPTDKNAFFNITSFDLVQNNFIVRWNAISGRVYSVDWSTNLLNDEFGSLAKDLAYPQSSYTDTVHDVETEKFYRINVQLEQ